MSRERTGLAFGQTARRWPTLPQMSQLLPLEGHVRARWPALPQTLQVFELATIFLSSRCGELGVMSRLRLVAAAGAACGAGSASSVPVEQQIKAAMGSGRGNATV